MHNNLTKSITEQNLKSCGMTQENKHLQAQHPQQQRAKNSHGRTQPNQERSSLNELSWRNRESALTVDRSLQETQ